MIPIVLLQPCLIGLESIAIVRRDHALKGRRRVRQDVRARVAHRKVGRYGLVRQVLLVTGCFGMTEGEESTVRVCRIWRVILQNMRTGLD